LWTVFWNTVSLSAIPFTLVMGYLATWPVSLEPAAWSPGFNPDLTGPYVSNDEISRAILLPVQWVEPVRRESQRYVGLGPETIAFRPGEDWLYTSLCDAEREEHGVGHACSAGDDEQGWVVRVDPRTHRVERYVQTGGRPLGLAFDAAGRLYIADGRRGLLRVEEAGKVRYAQLVATCELASDAAAMARWPAPPEREPERLREPHEPGYQPGPQPYFTDSVAVAVHDGAEEVWFTCPSQRWSLADIQIDALESRPTGRVLRYLPCDDADPTKCKKTLAADGLRFANGIAVDAGAGKVFVSEWGGYRVVALAPTASGRDGVWEVGSFAANLPGFPDNLTLESDGTLWVGLVIRRFAVVDRLHPYPLFEEALARIPGGLAAPPHAFAVAFDAKGKLVQNLQDTSGTFDQVTGAYPRGGALYLASNNARAIACVPKPQHPFGRGDVRPAPDRDPCRQHERSIQP
jgi:sugar lactone lactonase YvrE